MAEVEAIVEPNGVADYIWWESVACVGVHGPSLAISARKLASTLQEAAGKVSSNNAPSGVFRARISPPIFLTMP